MPRSLEFCFDYASPYSYFAQQLVPALTARSGVPVRYRPVLLGGIFKSTGNQAPMLEGCEPKRHYSVRTLQRWVAHYDVPFSMNPHFPVNTLGVMRACVAAQRAGVFDAFHAAVFPAMWSEGRNLGDATELEDVLERAGLDAKALLGAAQDATVKQELIANTEAAVASGAFGVPTFIVRDEDGGEELFWGADHMHFVERALAG